jgi:outer membrane lipoprotein-sorting protein
MRVKSLIFSILFGCAVFTGCVRQPLLFPDAKDPRLSGGFAAAFGTNDLVRAAAEIDVEQAGSYHTARAALLLKKPSYLRLEILSVMGITGLCVITAPEKMTVYLPSKNEFYSGAPSRQNIGKFLPLPLDAEEIVQVLIGSIPGLTDEGVQRRLEQENDVWRLEMNRPAGVSQTAFFNHKGLIRLTRSGEDPKQWLSVDYFYENAAESMPSKIVFTTADGGRVRITYTDVGIEKTDDVSMFDMNIPADATVIDLN